MISKAIFEIKSSIRSWSDQKILFSTKDIKNVSIIIKDTMCELFIDGDNEDDNLQNIIVIRDIDYDLAEKWVEEYWNDKNSK